jgi:hypothetical protein
MKGAKCHLSIQTNKIYAGKSSFALDNAKRRCIQYLKDNNQTYQILHIPETYPTQKEQLATLDIAVRAKILKAHLEDAFASNIFSIKITRRKTSHVLSITHDSLETDMVTKIAKLYTDSTTKLVVTKSQGIPLMIL